MSLRDPAATLFATAGILATVGASFVGLVYLPDAQLDPVGAVTLPGSGERYPAPLTGRAARGRQVYIGLGCIYCHSQQVRQEDFGGDISRGWGARASVPLDYRDEKPPLLGTMRTGPDLRNVGVRLPSEDWHYLHLYNPRIVSEHSIMPSYRFLFEEHAESESFGRPLNAIDVPAPYGPKDAWVAPKPDAVALVAYLKSLRHDVALPPGASTPEGPSSPTPTPEAPR